MKPLKASGSSRVIADRWADLEANWDDVLDVIG